MTTSTRTFWFERYGYDYKLYFTCDGYVDVSLFVDGDGFDAIHFLCESEREAHSRVAEEIAAYEECGF